MSKEKPFMWKGKDLKRYPEIIEVALKLKGKEQKKFAEAYCALGPFARSNIGYFSGYYDAKTAQKILKVFSATHPIFGDSHPTPKAAFKMGMKMGKKLRKEANGR